MVQGSKKFPIKTMKLQAKAENNNSQPTNANPTLSSNL
jgi:hypothetical protein